MRLITTALAALALLGSAISAQAQEYKWRMGTIAGETSIYVGLMAKPWADLVDELTEGKMKIEVFPGGVLAPIFKLHQSVDDGLIEVAHTVPAFLGTKDPTNAMIGSFPTGLGTDSFLNWLYQGGGLDLLVQHRRETMNMHVLVVGSGPSEFFAHSHKPIKSVDDLQGVKYRTLGNWAAIVKDSFGASPTVVPGSELYGMMEKKAIDLMEYSTPSENQALGFQEVAPYIIYPGIHAPAYLFEAVIQKDRWDALPDDIKRKMEIAAKITTFESMMQITQRDMDAMANLAKGKNEWIQLDQSFKDKSREAARAWALDQAKQASAAGNEWPQKVIDSIIAFQDRWRAHSRYMVVDHVD